MKEFPSSACVECGKAWPSGLQSYCEFGGFCTRYIPRALRVALADTYSDKAELLEAVKNQKAWIERLLEKLQHKTTGRDPHTNGYAYAEAIDWDLRQKLDSLKEDIAKAEGGAR